MGFQAVKRIRIIPTDGPYAGLEVDFKSMTVGQAMEVGKLKAQGDASLDEILEKVSGSLISWNIEDEFEKPVPPDVSGLMSLDSGLFKFILDQWVELNTSVPVPLDRLPSSHEISAEQSIPMETL